MSGAWIGDGNVQFEITVGALVFRDINVEAVVGTRNQHTGLSCGSQLSHADERAQAFLHILMTDVHEISFLAVE